MAGAAISAFDLLPTGHVGFAGHSPKVPKSASRNLGILMCKPKSSYSSSSITGRTKVKRNDAPELPVVNGVGMELGMVDAPRVRGLGSGGIVMDGPVSTQFLAIRSYEIGASGVTSMEAVLNLLQEAFLTHMKVAGLTSDGFAFATPEMCRRDLVWITTKKRVAVDRYPCWQDVIEVQFQMSGCGNPGIRGDWRVYDHLTQETLIRATTTLAMMDTNTRRPSRIPKEVRAELEPWLRRDDPEVNPVEDRARVPKVDSGSADYVREWLTPGWGDLDVNGHVNNVKYVNWILESIPVSLMEKHELASITLEYKRECYKHYELRSLTTVVNNNIIYSTELNVECVHRLELRDGTEILRGQTKWRPKHHN